ncbi:hypothetical protein MASR2M18_18730 [Ignavibacteria bacterium]|nr:hypothetical protein [Bacteroidota bacterium]
MYTVKYSGPFGFIKPWTAVRDTETFSQQFLTPSIIEGIEKKLFPELVEIKRLAGKIMRHRLSYSGISRQQEQTQPKAITEKKDGTISRGRSILLRGVMTDPVLWLAFGGRSDAETASNQHICLCRNEDILLPDANISEVSQEEFDTPFDGSERADFDGFELIFEKTSESFIVGYNRYDNAAPMYGRLHIVGNPIREVKS